MNRNTKLAQKVVFASKAFRLTKAARFGVVITAILSFLLFSISFYSNESGNFTFSVDQRAYELGLTLYEHADEKLYTSRLLAQQVDNADGMTDLCGVMPNDEVGGSRCIPPNDYFSDLEGSNNGENYIAYSFYVEMTGTGNYIADLVAEISIISTARGAEEAIRVKVIFDDVATVYAKLQSENGDNPGELEPYTDQAFYGPSTVMTQTFQNYVVGDVMKVTVIVWYEGYDPDHTINIWNGGVKMAMDFTVSNVTEISDEETT